MAQPLVTYQVESWGRYYPECLPLWEAHYEEFRPFHLGRMPFGPDVAMYQAAEAAGQLQILVARCAGAMVGYCLVLCRRHPHYAMICGFEDSYYITPAHRRGRTGVKLIDRSADLVRRRGIKMVFFMTKEFNTIERMLYLLGFTRCDSVHYKWLGGP